MNRSFRLPLDVRIGLRAGVEEATKARRPVSTSLDVRIGLRAGVEEATKARRLVSTSLDDRIQNKE